MKGPINKRSRGRSLSNGSGKKHMPVRNQPFDNGGEMRVRGNAHQVLEKYLALARDASAQGDRIAAENYYQHAEHYFRCINSANNGNVQRRPAQTPAEDQQPEEGDDEGSSESGQGGGESGQAESIGA
ncbi:MAG: DUF4167 domain-containing protein [Alphaproteobacteria bacterium]|nr:DUF4167 domain-containing protein [Alphaproteobacteria bacterium]MBF0334877.1 DUF4167 domain-containing protein [Alphaproteobacteria bacterium]